METPSNTSKKPNTRSHSRKKPPTAGPLEEPATDLANLPILRGRKRRKTGEAQDEAEPAAKKMAEDKILDAIKVVSASVTAMEKKWGHFLPRTI